VFARLRDGIEWFAVGLSLLVQAGVVLALVYIDTPADPSAQMRMLIEHGLVALAFLATAVGAFYLAARRVRRKRSRPATEVP
jgi:hypothetical protein